MHRDKIQIPNPCDEPWENMSGCGTKRHCARCAKSVYDLSEMTEDEVEQLFAERPPNLCVSYLADEQGVIQLKRKAKVGLAVGVALSLVACSNPFKRYGGEPPPVATESVGRYAGAPVPSATQSQSAAPETAPASSVVPVPTSVAAPAPSASSRVVTASPRSREARE